MTQPPRERDGGKVSDPDKRMTVCDPALYRELSKPFPGATAAQDAMEGFWRDLREIRAKRKLPNVCVVIAVAIAGEGGNESTGFNSLHCGDALQAEPMLAWALGQERAAARRILSAAFCRTNCRKRLDNPSSSTIVVERGAVSAPKRSRARRPMATRC